MKDPRTVEAKEERVKKALAEAKKAKEVKKK